MRLSIIILIMLPLFSFGKIDTGGIQFLTNLSWKQIQEKAKRENKFIFVDCYATWCGPCKSMDKDVYTQKKVGDYFQSAYLAVKVQMDVTTADNDTVKKWYSDAREIDRKYKITAYPTLLFFNPEGEIVAKEIGFKDPGALIALASKATGPDVKYQDEYKDYDVLVKAFRSGKMDIKKMPYLINTARSVNDTTLADSLSRRYEAALKNLPEARLFDSIHLSYLATIVVSAGTPFFRLFYPDGSKADRVMGQKGFAAGVVDRVIKKEHTSPALGKASQTGISPDWEQLYQNITAHFPVSYADRAVLAAKLRWYQYNRMWPSYDSTLMTIINKYGLASLDIYRSLYVNPAETVLMARDMTINWFAWDRVFMIDASKEAMQFAMQQMSGVVQRSKSFGPYWAYATRDTYANLFFKSGDKQQALKWENEALQFALELGEQDQIKNCRETIKKMSL